MNLGDLNILMDYGDEKPAIPYKNKEYNNKSVVQNELALHEAGHFVIERLLYKVKLVDVEFLPQNFMCINSEEKTGVVNDFMIKIDGIKNHWTDKNYERFKKAFLDNPKATYMSLFSLIAGYATYKQFIADNDYFISRMKQNKVCNMESVLRNAGVKKTKNDRYLLGEISDFAKIKERLSFLNIKNQEELLRVCNLLLKQVLGIMSIREVKLAILVVKGRLIDEDGQKIEGLILERIIEFTDYILSTIHIDSYLEEFERNILRI